MVRIPIGRYELRSDPWNVIADVKDFDEELDRVYFDEWIRGSWKTQREMDSETFARWFRPAPYQ